MSSITPKIVDDPKAGRPIQVHRYARKIGSEEYTALLVQNVWPDGKFTLRVWALDVTVPFSSVEDDVCYHYYTGSDEHSPRQVLREEVGMEVEMNGSDAVIIQRPNNTKWKLYNTIEEGESHDYQNEDGLWYNVTEWTQPALGWTVKLETDPVKARSALTCKGGLKWRTVDKYFKSCYIPGKRSERTNQLISMAQASWSD